MNPQKSSFLRGVFITLGIVIIIILIIALVSKKPATQQAFDLEPSPITDSSAPIYAPPTIPTPSEETAPIVTAALPETQPTPAVTTTATENITTPLYVKNIYKKDAMWWADVDYVTLMSGQEHLQYAINNGSCALSNMSKEATLAYAKKQTSATIATSLFMDAGWNCPGDWPIVFANGNITNQSSKIRSFPFASNFIIKNNCAPTYKDIEDIKFILKNNPNGVLVLKATIQNNKITVFDFVNGCAG